MPVESKPIDLILENDRGDPVMLGMADGLTLVRDR